MATAAGLLERLAADWGLGAALEAAWHDGLEVGHIPVQLPGLPPVLRTHATAGCRYEFVHVPVRRIRTDTAALVERGIVNGHPDPFGLVFHEDGLITLGTLLEGGPPGLTEDEVRAIIQALVAGGVLVRADVNSRQLQFVDPAVRRRHEDSGEVLYVRLVPVELAPAVARALWEVPAPSSWSDADDGASAFEAVVRHVAGRLGRRSACTYCSGGTLFPRQVTFSTAHVRSLGGRRSRDLETDRDYQFGFTLAPFGDPTRVCHLLAWDVPRVGRLASMVPHDRSFSDLVRLVRVINRDVERLEGAIGAPRTPLAGVCNHLAGNTLLHQHYQFFRIPDLPLPLVCDRVLAEGRAPFARPRGVEIHRLGDDWPVPAYLIRATRKDMTEEFCDVVDEVAAAWGAATADGESWRTQNTWAWSRGSEVRAIFLPRDRRRVNALGPDRLRKNNAGVLEMMGWFLVDDLADYDDIAVVTECQRRALGDAWLAQLAPDEASVAAFERALHAIR